MINSTYILNILELLLDGDNDGIAARNQLTHLTENHFEYSNGGGLIVSFTHDNEIEHYRNEKDDLILDGVKIESAEYNIEAIATLFFSNGIIDYLDIWCCLGEYPENDLTKYTLTQTFLESNNKQLKIE